jgi:hypothetical protein
MNKAQFDQLIISLSWTTTASEREHAIDELTHIDDQLLYMLVLPGEDKSLWQGAALALQRIGYPRIGVVMPQILTWLQDLNWPGAREIFDTLVQIDTQILMPHLKKALMEALETRDEDWLMWMKLLLERKGIPIEDLESPELIKALERIRL